MHDKWTASESAVRQLGFRSAPPVNHKKGWRDTETGYRTNDIESENARIKGWARKLYGRVILTENDLYEYTFWVNCGRGLAGAMEALAADSGGALAKSIA